LLPVIRHPSVALQCFNLCEEPTVNPGWDTHRHTHAKIWSMQVVMWSSQAVNNHDFSGVPKQQQRKVETDLPTISGNVVVF
jgi:hypothetical protein